LSSDAGTIVKIDRALYALKVVVPHGINLAKGLLVMGYSSSLDDPNVWMRVSNR